LDFSEAGALESAEASTWHSPIQEPSSQ
jgi:hypothetical protein